MASLSNLKKHSLTEKCFILQITLLDEKLKQYCKVPYKIKVYPGQVHGFAQLKPEDMKPADKPYIEEARKDMVDWIKTFIWQKHKGTLASKSEFNWILEKKTVKRKMDRNKEQKQFNLH